MPPPSSGGPHLVQILNMLEPLPLAQWGPNSAQTIHHMAESSKLAYADRSEYLGDPDFVKIPLKGLAVGDGAVSRAVDLACRVSATRSVPASSKCTYAPKTG